MLGRQCVADEKGFSRLPKNSSDNQWQVFLSLTFVVKILSQRLAKETDTWPTILPLNMDGGSCPPIIFLQRAGITSNSKNPHKLTSDWVMSLLGHRAEQRWWSQLFSECGAPEWEAGFSDTRVGLTKNTNYWGSSQANCDSESVAKAQKSFFFFFSFLAAPHGMQDLNIPDQGSNPYPLQWKPRVLTTGPLGIP